MWGGLSARRSRRARRRGLHSPPPLRPLRKSGGSYPPSRVAAAETPEAGLDARGIRGELKIQRKAPLPRAQLRPHGFCPPSRCLPQEGEGRRGEAGAPSPFWFPLLLQQLLPNEPWHGDVQPTSHPQLHTSRSENWEGGRRAGRGSWSWSEARERELTCKRAVLLGSGLLDHDVDILLNSLLP